MVEDRDSEEARGKLQERFGALGGMARSKGLWPGMKGLDLSFPWLKAAEKLSLANQGAMARYANAMLPLQEAATRAAARLQGTSIGNPELRAQLEKLAKNERQCMRLEACGWLPHSSAPFALVTEDVDDEELDAAVQHYFETEWPRIGAKMVSRIRRCSIDQEAKDTFAEAVAAHGAGLFRCAPRLLYPEIERVVRVERPAGAEGVLTSQRTLREAMGGLTPAQLSPTGVVGLRLYNKLMDHMYATLKTPEALAQALPDTTPNRHAALHGLISYNTHKNSINAIVMTDYLLQAIATLKDLSLSGR